MRRDIRSYSGLEKKLDDILPTWIVPVGRVLRELEVDNQDSGNLRWGFRVKFKGKTVSKATPVNKDGELFWRAHDTKFAIPDFVILDKERMKVYQDMVQSAKQGLMTVNPFRHLMGDLGWYVEALGNHFHTDKYVRGLSREEHEAEIVAAYESAGAHVLVLWEDDIEEGWLERGLPKLIAYLTEAAKVLNLPEFDRKEVVTPDNLDIDAWRSLFSPQYYRSLEVGRKEAVLEKIFKMMRRLDYPRINEHVAQYDLNRFLDWSKGSRRKPTRFGADFCSFFVTSIADARVTGQRSSQELWADDVLLKKCIRWQMENEDGIHHAKRFLHAMRHESGFRVVSNLHPSFVCHLIDKYFGDVKGKAILDPCAGWGGRMLAAYGLGARYCAIDANKKLVGELNEMSRFLRADTCVVHGDAAQQKTVDLAAGELADFVLTSPPYFGLEEYSNDKEQSSSRKTIAEWLSEFFMPMVSGVMGRLKEGGKALFIVNDDFDSEPIRGMSGVRVLDEFIFVEHGGKRSRERVLIVEKGEVQSTVGVKCRICNRFFEKLGWHVVREHGLDMNKYRVLFPAAETVSPEMKNRIAEANHRKVGLEHVPRVAYRCPDGSYVRKRDAWKRAWADQPPADSIVDASTVDLDPWAGKVEGVDYVVCRCGYKAANLTQHLRRQHGGLDGHNGPVKSQGCARALQEAAKKTWDTRGRKPAIENPQTHKRHGLTKEILEQLYSVDGLSDAKIGERYGMTGEGIAYQRKKFGIATRKRVLGKIQ
jgi:tRNA1(Val) A37 N6-methylase TrmN6